MGQYQQWLHYRAVEQQLSMQLEQLEKELALLQEQEDLLADSAAATENIIIRALARQFAPSPYLSLNAISHQGGVEKPIDQHSIRTGRLVERWVERWGRHPAYAQGAQENLQLIFAELHPYDVEQFYESYHYWLLRQHKVRMQTELAALQQQLRENTEQMERENPGAVALAALARLQSSGVNNIDLLDRMLERGEVWLDHIMQLLEHCERLKVISGDYTRWCEFALQGAYDWVASMLEASASPPVASQPATSFDQTTEEMLLQKLMGDDEREVSPITLETAPVLASISSVETTEPEEVKVLAGEEPASAEEVEMRSAEGSSLLEELIGVLKTPLIQEPAPEEGSKEQDRSAGSAEVQASLLIQETSQQDQGIIIPETPRPELLETEAEVPETEEELVAVTQSTLPDMHEDIHAVEEIMYFTDEASWQWEEPVSMLSGTSTPIEESVPVALPDKEKPVHIEEHEEQGGRDVKPQKQGLFQRFLRRIW
jgi:hypothetical protein